MSEKETTTQLKEMAIDESALNELGANGVDNQEEPKEKPAEVPKDNLALAKEHYTKGSRLYLLKQYSEAIEEMSKACELYEKVYGLDSPLLGMPFLMYAKSLIGLAIEESDLINPEAVTDDKDEDEENDDDDGDGNDNAANGEDDSKPTAVVKDAAIPIDKPGESANCSSVKPTENGAAVENGLNDCEAEGENEDAVADEADEDLDAGETDTDKDEVSNFQLAWEILELAAKAFRLQGMKGYSYLAEVYTELGNIQFENNDLQNACKDFERALKLYEQIPERKRRAMAEIYYKVGLAHITELRHKESLSAFKEACLLIEEEIEYIKTRKDEINAWEKRTIETLEEMKADIMVKAAEVKDQGVETQDRVKEFLRDYTQNAVSTDAAAPVVSSSNTGASTTADGPCSSKSHAMLSSSSSSSSSSKGNDISHLIKRKRELGTDADNSTESSPAKRSVVE